MAEYIEREAAKRALADSDVVPKYKADNRPVTDKIIDDIPAADVAPVVHGKWVPSDGNPGFLVCSACEDCYVVAEWADEKKWMYCPACGAKMDKEEDNDQT